MLAHSVSFVYRLSSIYFDSLRVPGLHCICMEMRGHFRLLSESSAPVVPSERVIFLLTRCVRVCLSQLCVWSVTEGGATVVVASRVKKQLHWHGNELERGRYSCHFRLVSDSSAPGARLECVVRIVRIIVYTSLESVWTR